MTILKLVPSPGETYDADSKPPSFGHPLKQYFALDDSYINLNNGSYGSLPLPVVYAAKELMHEIESNPDLFHRLKCKPLVIKAREAVANTIGADTDEVVLVPNASHALNEILRNFEWREGDLLIGATTSYGAVLNTMRYLSDRSEQPRPNVLSVEYNFPLLHAEIIDHFRSKLREAKQLHANTQFTDMPPLSPGYTTDAAARKNKIVAVIDSITALPGAFMPWREMVCICREEGVWSVIDGAHSIGQEPDINLGEIQPDFFLSNCHKWFWAKRGCAVLYVPKRNQLIMKTSIPTGHEYVSPHSPLYEVIGTNFVNQHELTGTVDKTPYVTIPDAIAFRQWLGGEAVINKYCHQLALDGAKKLVEIMGTRDMDVSGEITLNMCNVQLPLPVESTRGELYTAESIKQINGIFCNKLLLDWKAYATHYFHNGAWWCRCSAQVFNEVSDFEHVGKAFKSICKEIENTLLPKNTS